MALSEKTPEDKQKLKNGMIGFVLILVVGQISPILISEFTGVDLNEVCIDIPDDELEDCIDVIKNSDIKSGIQEIVLYVRIGLGVIAFIVIAYVIAKY